MQTTLLGEQKEEYLCVNCSWIGLNPNSKKVQGYSSMIELETCPKCDWACYTLEESKKFHNCYPVLEDKIKKLS